MDSWGIEPQPLTRPCVGCGGAFRYLNRLNLCDGCQEDYNADMELVDAYERDADDRDATHTYYGR